MAETVGLHIECMIPELEQMKRLGLFTADEIQEIVKKRKEFEYKIIRTMKEKQDFLRYINFEVKLLREIKLRRDKLHLSEKKSEIEYAVAKKIVKLYQLSLSYFKSDVRMWVSYISFCTQTRFTTVVSQAFKQMLQVHSDKKHLWIFAAKWELSESSNIEGALNYLKTGLHHHPNAQELYAEAFRLELKLGTIHSSDTPPEEIKNKQEKAIRRASVHFKVAINAIGTDIDFIISLLNIATEYKYTEDLQHEIIDFMTKNCWKSEFMWHTMAQRELNGHIYSKKDRHKSKTKLCIAVYKSAVKILPTALMWEKYLDTIIEVSRDEKRKEDDPLSKSLLEDTFQEAMNGGFLQEQHYLYWLETLTDDPKYPDVLEKATSSIPTSVDLWINRMKYYATLNDDNKFKDIGKEAIKALGKNSLQIYRCLIKHYQIKYTQSLFCNEIKEIFEEGISRPEPEISLPLRPQYIEWLSFSKPIKFIRSEYDRLAHRPPFCLELHKKMAEIETGRFTLHLEYIRNIHKLACYQFGKDKTEVWMDYIKFEQSLGDPAKVADIYSQAMNNLNENVVHLFTTEFAIKNTQ